MSMNLRKSDVNISAYFRFDRMAQKQKRISKSLAGTKEYSEDKQQIYQSLSQQQLLKLHSDNPLSSQSQHSADWKSTGKEITRISQGLIYYEDLAMITAKKNMEIKFNISKCKESEYALQDCERAIATLQHYNSLSQRKIVLKQLQDRKIEKGQFLLKADGMQIQKLLYQTTSFQIDQSLEGSIKLLQHTLEDKYFDDRTQTIQQRFINRMKRYQIQQTQKLDNMKKMMKNRRDKDYNELRQKEKAQKQSFYKLFESKKKQKIAQLEHNYERLLPKQQVIQSNKLKDEIIYIQSKIQQSEQKLITNKKKKQQFEPNSPIHKLIDENIKQAQISCNLHQKQFIQKKSFLQYITKRNKTNLINQSINEIQKELKPIQLQLDKTSQLNNKRYLANIENDQQTFLKVERQYNSKLYKYQQELNLYRQSRQCLNERKKWNQNLNQALNQCGIITLVNQFYYKYSYLRQLLKRSTQKHQRFYSEDELLQERGWLELRTQKIQQEQQRCNILKDKYLQNKGQIQRLEQSYKLNLSLIAEYESKLISLKNYMKSLCIKQIEENALDFKKKTSQL